MAGGKDLTPYGRNILTQVERDLGILKNIGYFTDEQFVQLDFIIHHGKYFLTEGPQQTLVDFFGPLDGSSCDEKNVEKSHGDENADLLLSNGSGILNPSSGSGSKTGRSSNYVKSPESEVAPWRSHKMENKAVSMGARRPHEDLSSYSEIDTRIQGARRLNRIESDTADEWKKKIGILTTTAFRPQSTPLPQNMPDPELLRKVDNHEADAARAWEQDDDEDLVQPPSQISESQTVPKHDSPARDVYRNGRSDGMSDAAAKVVAEIRTDLRAIAESEIQRATMAIRNANSDSPKPLDPRVCYYWATPDKNCGYGDKCKKLHYYPSGDSPSWRQPAQPANKTRKARRQKTGQVNGKLASYRDPKTNVISTKRHLTCWFWKNREDCGEPGGLCPLGFSHEDTGEYAKAPWYREADVEDTTNGNTSVTSGEERDESTESKREDAASGNDSAKVEATVMNMQVELGSSEDEEIELETDRVAQEIRSAAEKVGWGDEVNMAVKAPSENEVGIFGASAGGWGDDDLEQTGTGTGWNTVSNKKAKKPKDDELITW